MSPGTESRERSQEAVATPRPQDNLAFLERLHPAERQAILNVACPCFYEASAVICREGDPAEGLYLIQTGRVAVLKEVEEGRPILLGYHGPGEILGEVSLVGQQPRSASLVSVEDSHLLVVRAKDFPTLMECNPGISQAILNVLNDRLQEADVARTAIIQEEELLAQRLELVTGEATRLAELARVRKETVELVVHDLRTPLAVIVGCLEMMRSALSDDALASVRQILDIAEHSSQRMLALTEDLLETAKREVPSGALARRPLNVGRLLESAVDSARTSEQAIGLELVVEVPRKLPLPRGDVAQLQRVVDNLLDNAMSFTPPGGLIRLSARQTDGEIEVGIADTGPGVPSDYRQAIFERFIRVPGTQGKRQGFGLGLYFCRQVIRAHGGRIWVEPGPNDVGSRFVFTLPLDQEPTHA